MSKPPVLDFPGVKKLHGRLLKVILITHGLVANTLPWT